MDIKAKLAMLPRPTDRTLQKASLNEYTPSLYYRNGQCCQIAENHHFFYYTPQRILTTISCFTQWQSERRYHSTGVSPYRPY